MENELVRTLAIAVSAAVACIMAYHQLLHIRGATLVVLDRKGAEPQRSRMLTYANLPAEIRNQYPDYRDTRGYHALIRLPIANEGDRAGYLKMLAVELTHSPVQIQGTEPNEQVRFSHYTYTAVPAFAVALHTILIRNLPKCSVDYTIEIGINMELGRVHPLWRRHDVRHLKSYRLEVTLQPPNPEMVTADLANGA